MRGPGDDPPTRRQRLLRAGGFSLLLVGLYQLYRHFQGDGVDLGVGALLFAVSFPVLYVMRDGFRGRGP